LIGMAAVAIADGDEFIDLTTLNAQVTHNGAVFVQGGVGAGTGNYDPFLQVQETGPGQDGVEMGYNTEPVGNGEFDTKSISSGNTHSLQVAAVPVLEIDGIEYREFSLDSNDTGGDSFMSVDEIKIFVDNQFALTDYDNGAETFGNDTGSAATKIWDLDQGGNHTILVQTQGLEPGSGVSDITVLVPNTVFPAECSYGSLTCNKYLIFWTMMGEYREDDGVPDYDADSGFEEWRVRLLPVVNVSKTAVESFQREYTWDITKAADPTSRSAFAGDTVGFDYDVNVDQTVTDSAMQVTGTVTITNPTGGSVIEEDIDATITAVADFLSGFGPVTLSCPGVTLPYVLEPQESIECTYTASGGALNATFTGTNTATVTIINDVGGPTSYDGTAAVDFNGVTPTIVGYPTVNVTDSIEGTLGAASGDALFEYTQQQECSSDPGDYTNGAYSFDVDNTATITETGQDDDETVTVNCYAPVVAKTAAGVYTLTHEWAITKDADATYNKFIGDSATTHNYTITVDETETPSGYQVSGNITVQNPHPSVTMTVNLADQLNDGTPGVLAATCSLSGGGTDDPSVGGLAIPAGQTATCGYSATGLGGDETSNTATATLNSIGFSDTEPFTFVKADSGPTSVSVSDDNGTPADLTDDRPFGPFTGDATPGYSRDYGCPTDPAAYTAGVNTRTVTNTASLVGATGSDTAVVTVNCYAPVVSKTATGTYDETHTWDVQKSADPSALSGFAGGSAGSTTWTIFVDETVVNSGYAVSGTITVENPNPAAAMTVSLADQLSDGTAGAISSCTGDADLTNGLTIAAGGSSTCSYTATGDTDGNATWNRATATLNGIGFSDTEDFMYTPNVVGPTAVDLADSRAGLPDQTGITDDTTLTYQEPFTCSSTTGDYTNGVDQDSYLNTATITATGFSDSDDASVTVTCYAPVVTKDALERLTRTYTWNIDKVGDQTALTLAIGQQFLVDYDVTVSATYADSNWGASGTITVQNPHPSAAMTVEVSDSVSGVGAATVDCDAVTGGNQTSLTVTAASSGTCSYVIALPDAATRTNTATATINAVGFTGTAEIDFSGATIDEVDECITVTDDKGGPLGTVCYDELPKTFEYSLYVGPYAECGSYEYVNVASFVTNDSGGTGSDFWTVTVTVPCPGCTLTQGYWKTHSSYGPAPYDDTWALLPNGADTPFFVSGQTWYEVFWTAPEGGNAYYQLAHQYMAAKLNILNGASAPAEVTAAITWAENFFATAVPTGDYKGKDGRDIRTYASTLASYNEGLIGPGHCSEDAFSLLQAPTTANALPMALTGLTAALMAWMVSRGRHVRDLPDLTA
jgi:hypothetical protein